MTALETARSVRRTARPRQGRRERAATAVAVTGLGIVAPNGLGTEEYWSATLRGEVAIRRLTRFDPARFPACLAGEIDGFQPEEHLPVRLLTQTDRVTEFALVAADRALADAGVTSESFADFAIGVVTASAAGGFEFGQNELQKLWSLGGSHVSAYQSFAWFYAVNTGQISIRNDLRGGGAAMVADQAGGLDAVAAARRAVTREHEPMSAVVTGGVDASLCPWGWAAQTVVPEVSRSEDPERAYLPFDREARGYVPGEGGAVLIVEDPAGVPERGCQPYGLITGHGSVFEPDEGPAGLIRSIGAALADAGLDPADVDLVFADAAGTREADAAEAEALHSVFGEATVPVTAPKSMIGRLSSGGAPVDLAAALLSIRDQVIPPTVGVHAAPELGLDLVVGAPRPHKLRTVLVLARGRRGFVSAMVVEAVSP